MTHPDFISLLCLEAQRKGMVIYMSKNDSHVGGAVKSGITFGSALAMIISYTQWKSIGWVQKSPE